MRKPRNLRKNLLALVALLLFFGLAYFFVGGGWAEMRRAAAPPIILELDFDHDYPEVSATGAFDQLLRGRTLTVRDVVEVLDAAARDDKVVGLLARVGNAPMGLARTEEIRDAVLRFRESGKPAVAWSMTFGEIGPANGPYYLATAFDEIHLQPNAEIGFLGLRAEYPFARNLLDKLQVDLEVERREEFKTIANHLTETGFTETQRESEQHLVDDLFDHMVRGVAAGRESDPETVREWVAAGPFFAHEALTHGMVDFVHYRDEVYESMRQRFRSSPRMVSAQNYAEDHLPPRRDGEVVALITGDGAIVRGRHGADFLTGTRMQGADSIGEAIRAAVEDPEVRAILYRVTSPGGSLIASEAIWRELRKARSSGIPVVVSMGDVAASGGYFVAMGADRVVAQPTTVTGSVGVNLMKFTLPDTWAMAGISWDAVMSGENADLFSSLEPLRPEQREHYSIRADFYYDLFLGYVAEGRGMDVEEVRAVAGGRVWSGREALQLGMVDALGGLDVALEQARELAGIDPDVPLRLRSYPRPKTLWQRILSGEQIISGGWEAEVIGSGLRSVRAWAWRLGLTDNSAPYYYANPTIQ